MENQEHSSTIAKQTRAAASTVTMEDDGVLRLADAEIQHLGGIEHGDRFEFEVIDEQSFRVRKLRRK